MVTNAKRFYEKGSETFADAERIRKMLANWMPRHNPAYKDPNYQSFPTPLPGEAMPGEGKNVPEEPDGEADAEAVTDDEVAPQNSNSIPPGAAGKAQGSPAKPPARAASFTPAAQNAEDEEDGFEGVSFQHAQEKIVHEMFNLKDDE